MPRSRSFEGSGSGLALVQEIVKLHGGRIRVESEAGRGTTFVVTLRTGHVHLPQELVQAEAPTSTATATGADDFIHEAAQWLSRPSILPVLQALDSGARPGKTTEFRGRVLLADDNADMREYIRTTLEGAFVVETVPDGDTALERALAEPPDLVLTDVMMPGLDGFALLDALRRDPRTADVPVILLSARAGEEATVEGLAAGAQDYLAKPFSARELRARVEGAVHTGRDRTDPRAALAELAGCRIRA